MVVVQVAELTSKWNSLAEPGDSSSLVVDCSNVQLLSSAMLSKLILLQCRLKRKRKARVVLFGLRAEVREVLKWTKLDRYFEINADEVHSEGNKRPSSMCNTVSA